MRYLFNVILCVAIAGSSLLIFQERNAWKKHTDKMVTDIGSFNEVDLSPDGTRRLLKIMKINSSIFPTTGVDAYDGVLVVDSSSGSVLTAVCLECVFSSKFVDNNMIEILMRKNDGKLSIRRYKRTHPEWWWGHFYRPEVWAFLFFCTLLLWRLIRLKWRVALSRTQP
jgi:hypothetical protein